jgi:hypothetical protein
MAVMFRTKDFISASLPTGAMEFRRQSNGTSISEFVYKTRWHIRWKRKTVIYLIHLEMMLMGRKD